MLNSYSLLFFSNNKLFAGLLLIVSFFNPYSGLAGVVAALLSLIIAHVTGLDKTATQEGIYSYNALLIGIGMGAVYNFSIAFWILLFVIVIFSVILSSLFQSLLGKYRLPFLIIPFVLCFWLILLVTKDFAAIDFTFRNIYWLNDAYAIGRQPLVRFIMFMENMQMPSLVSTFFRALSSLYFQNNILAGMIMAFGIFIHSRIIFSLIIIGFLTAYGFNHIVMAYPEGINYYLIGGNFILVSVAVGGFFTVPSLYSYFWAILSVPITFLIVMGLGKITGQWNLPVLSMPFSITVLCLLYFFSLKKQNGKVILTPLQLYAPEKNLYNYLSNSERLMNSNMVRLQLPFIGKWMVSQGYDGHITHKGDWSKALDFIIVDNELKTYDKFAINPANFYCYGKPVLAPADGFVQQVEDYIEDNEVGMINQKQNWGNSIVIRHSEGLYTKMSHLRQDSFKVKAGDYVKQGDVVAACGNSGRSPEPHLHFQVQTTPYIGSKTFAWPLAHYISEKNGVADTKEFLVPGETEIVYNILPCSSLKKAFEFLPGYILTVTAEEMNENKWEIFTDAFNHTYFYCHYTKAIAYFKINESIFYFTAFEGNKNSLLYYFYLAAFKIFLSTKPSLPAFDKYPLQLSGNHMSKWLQDILAPFVIFSRLHYESLNKAVLNDFLNPSILIESKQTLQFMNHRKQTQQFEISVKDNRIISFTFLKNKKMITAICTPKDY